MGGVDGLSEGAKATLNGRWGKGMGSRIREDRGKGGKDGSPHPRGQEKGRGRWVPAFARTGEREGKMGPRIREDNGWGRAVAEPALRCKVGDGG